MKNLLLAAVLCAAPIAYTGCALFSSTSTQEQKLADVQRLAYAAASLGTQEALLQNATWKSQFATAYANLDVLVKSKVVTGALLRAVIASLPVKELKSPQARLAIDAALTLYDVTAGTKVDLEQAPYALAAATGLRDGLKAGLGF